MSGCAAPVWLRKLQQANPQLEVTQGGSHYKLKVDGRLIAILPFKLKYNGIATNTRKALLREGLTIPKLLWYRYILNAFMEVYW